MDRALTVGAGVVLLAGCVVPLSVPAGSGGASGGEAAGEVAGESTACVATPGHRVLARVNEIRVGHGLRPVAPEAALVRAAAAHTADQAAQGPAGVGHIGSDGSAPGERVTAAGYDWRMVAENVAAGAATPTEVVRGWMDSPPHRATILAPEPVHAGIGYVHRFDGRLNHYWTLVVAAPRSDDGGDVVVCHP